MKIETAEIRPGLLHVALDGRLDADSSHAIEEEFETHLVKGKDVIVDLAKVSFVGSIGLRLLVAGAKAKYKKSGRMALVVTDAKIQWVFKTSGIDQVIPIFDSLSAASASIS